MIPANGQPADPHPLTILSLVAITTAMALLILRRPDLLLPAPPPRRTRTLRALAILAAVAARPHPRRRLTSRA